MRRRGRDLYQPHPRGRDGRERAVDVGRLRQPAQGRRAQCDPDRRVPDQPQADRGQAQGGVAPSSLAIQRAPPLRGCPLLFGHAILLAMIETADEFCRLRTSQNPEEYNRAGWEEAPLQVWHEVIEKFPDMRHWVAYNKTGPMEILAILAGDSDGRVRHMVASKRKLSGALQLKLSTDPDRSVRQALVANRKVTREALQVLVND